LVGQTVSHYRILEKLGEGGMGEVYRANDSKLNRDVALKILPQVFAQDSQRMARFEREAQVLASLNHPHIAQIHGLEDSEDVHALVLELVEGETLAERLDRGPIPVDEALEIALQIAEGLEAAHEHGIIHRDLKPANIKITPDEQVKILDFGLAKAMEGEAPVSDPSRSPTITQEATQAGVILGTAAYMSPEQARGKPVDRRSDVWAFGCVLYEMLTGSQVFKGDSITDLLAAICREEPEWTVLPAETPESLRRLLRRSLAKEPRRRLSSLADARLEIEEATEETTIQPPALSRRSVPRSLWLSLAITGGLLIIALVILLVWGAARESESSIIYRPLTHQRGGIRSACISPDGQTLIYSAAWEGKPLQLFLRRLDSAVAPPVELKPGHARLLAISSRGEIAILLPPEPDMVILPGFRSGTLARIPLTGGTPRAVAKNVRSADWDPSGERFALVRGVENGVQLEYPAGEVLHRAAGDIGCVRVSPSGDFVAFFDHPFANNNRGTVAAVTGDGTLRTLTPEMENLTGLAWSPDGSGIWFSGSDEAGKALFAVDLSGRLRVLRRSPGHLTLHDTTSEGLALVSHYIFHVGIAALPSGGDERDLSWGEVGFVTDISADGGHILFMTLDEMVYDAWLRHTDGSAPTRLGSGVSFSLSPNGKWAMAGLLSRSSPLTLLPTGPGIPRQLDGKSGALFADWTPDGRSVVWAAAGAEGETRLYIQGIDGGEISAISAEGIQTGVDRPFHVSPDGRWVAAIGPADEIKLYPTDGGEPREVSGALPGEEPSGWTQDGGALYVSQTGVLPAQIFQLDLRTGDRSLLYELMPRDPAGIAGVFSFVITPDGKGYAYSYARYLDSLYLVSGLN
jgi:serine/threonine protein kinase